MGNCLDSSSKVDKSRHANSASSASNVSSNTTHSTVPSGSSSLGSLVPTQHRTEGEMLSSPNLKAFSYNELKNATRSFRPDSMIGEGDFGCVFKGWIDETTLTASRPGSGIAVAIKQLKPDGFQGRKEWLEYNAKLSYIGLAEAGPTGDDTHLSTVCVSTFFMGTQGYAAPEYIATDRLTAKSDVYSFGVVLLELISGRRAMDYSDNGVRYSLVDWAKPYLDNKRKQIRIMDTKLGKQYPQKGACTVATLALKCLNPEAELRPKMSEVLVTLEQLESAAKPGTKYTQTESLRARLSSAMRNLL
ncbi:hypothetical protein Bca4012_038042 [Brassica carinata]